MTGCPGCHVGPEDECEAGCPASLLVRLGWTPEQAEDILSGRWPRRGPDLNLEVDDSPLLRLSDG